MTAHTRRLQPSLPVLTSIIAALTGGLILFIAAVLVWTVGYQIIYAGRIFPGVSVAGVEVSSLSPDEAAVKLNQTLSYPTGGKVVFRDGDRMWVASPVELGLVFDPSASARGPSNSGAAEVCSVLSLLRSRRWAEVWMRVRLSSLTSASPTVIYRGSPRRSTSR
jgi:hypothetical protein